MAKNNEKNINVLSDEALGNVSGGVIGPDKQYYAIYSSGLKYGSQEYIDFCKQYNLDPYRSLEDIQKSQAEINQKNAQIAASK